ncbi:MAG: metallophosphoesterase [Lachnospiraceae bacterium]|nr:metallophosphoesterase [Lachnospiraceae bacterium]
MMWWHIIWFLPMAVVLWLVYEWVEHNWIQYTVTETECSRIPAGQQIKLCLISDLHNNKKNLPELLLQIEKFAPELILLAGDMVDRHKEENPEAEAFLQALSGLPYPVYYSVGNHEGSMMEKQPEAWNAYRNRIGCRIKFLDNQSDTIRLGSLRIAVTGLSLPKIFYRKGALCEKKEELPVLSIPENDLHILLAHNPEYARLYDRYQADLIVSGHLHGGLLRLPWIGGVVSPRLRLAGKDAGLVSLSRSSSMYISRGLGSHTIPLRFFNRVEVNFLILKGKR